SRCMSMMETPMVAGEVIAACAAQRKENWRRWTWDKLVRSQEGFESLQQRRQSVGEGECELYSYEKLWSAAVGTSCMNKGGPSASRSPLRLAHFFVVWLTSTTLVVALVVE